MLTHVVTAANSSHYREQLHQMFNQRRVIFKEALGWSDLRINEQGEERDEYDDELAAYLLVLDDRGLVLASMIFRPIVDKCLLFKQFVHLLEGGPDAIRHDKLWESSRYVLMPHLQGEVRIETASLLNIAALKFSLSRGVTQFLGISSINDLSRNRKTGWRTTILGLPATYCGRDAFAFVTEVSRDAISDIRSRTGNFARCCVELPAMKAPNDQLPISEFIELLHEMSHAWEGEGGRINELVEDSQHFVSAASRVERRNLH
jgi:N-acyl-L-homoserine lactone synthetase